MASIPHVSFTRWRINTAAHDAEPLTCLYCDTPITDVSRARVWYSNEDGEFRYAVCGACDERMTIDRDEAPF